MQLTVNKHQIKLSNLDKIFWPNKNYTKSDLINYYIKIYPYLEIYLKNRPLSLKIYPDGIEGKSFYQKNCPDHAPDWLTTTPIYSEHRKNIINWIIVNNLSDLIWISNHAAIELHSWFSTLNHPQKPDFAVFDLDPGLKTGFKETIEISLLLKKILNELNLTSYVKTSGKSGLHIYVPLNPVYTFRRVRKFLKIIADILLKLKPDLVTTEWRKKKRKGKVYIDYRQNARGKTIPAPYSLRPTPEATVSTPLEWSELTPHIKPNHFEITTIKQRLKEKGDLWQNLFSSRQNLPGFLT